MIAAHQPASDMNKTIINHLLLRQEKNKNQVAVQYKDSGRWRQYSWHEYFSLVESVGAGLLNLDVNIGDRVAIMSNSRLEWAVADLAILGVGAVTVPIYPNNLAEDVEFILNNAEVKVLFIEDQQQIEKWERMREKCPTVKSVIVLNSQAEPRKDYISWRELLNSGRQSLRETPKMFADCARELELNQMATLLYTSGTTGKPKGVVITHEQIMSELTDVFNLVALDERDISLSFLPYSHILGRIELWGHVYVGYVLSFAESIDKLKANLKEVKPTFLIAVPRIFEKIYAGILAQVENSQIKRKIFNRAHEIGLRVSDRICQKKPLGIELSLEYEAAKRLVFNNVLNAFGGRIRYAVSGGAPLNSQIARFFHGLGLLVMEGYGLTETTAAVTFNSPLNYKFGSVGKPLADVDIQIATDGEVLVKSKKVMKEYYNNPEATAAAIKEGYFSTGDIGHIDDEGYLHITDRKKDLIKTAGGKYVAPQKLEALLKENSVVSQVLIHGDQKKYIVALVTLNQPYQSQYNSHETYNLVKDIVAEANTHLASHESIKKFAILPGDFTVETGELTPSLKVKRRFCDNKFKAQIDELY